MRLSTLPKCWVYLLKHKCINKSTKVQRAVHSVGGAHGRVLRVLLGEPALLRRPGDHWARLLGHHPIFLSNRFWPRGILSKAVIIKYRSLFSGGVGWGTLCFFPHIRCTICSRKIACLTRTTSMQAEMGERRESVSEFSEFNLCARKWAQSNCGL